ncbi:MAG TPA: alpha-ketoacid dehydrogenase subunit beta [Chloroflexota bacterium]|nr:alpha-ketoacid dehydrogenase subunit beta [Chloroflexota bacterium]
MRELQYRDAIREALREELLRDPAVVLIGEEMIDPWGGTFGVTKGLSTEFGEERIRNTPISEAAIIGCAVGAALAGMRPVAEIMFLDFIATGMDQVVNQAAKLRYMSGGQVNVPMVIRAAGGSGRASAAQHSQSLEAWFIHVPGIKVVMPSTPYDAKGLLKTAIRDPDPVLFIEHKMMYNNKGPVPEEEYLIPLGVADIKRAGRDVTVVATSRMAPRVLAVAERLAATGGPDIEVIDPRTLVPLDRATILASVRKTHRLVIVHEAVERGGFGAELASIIGAEAFTYLDAPIQRVAAFNTPVPFAPDLEDFLVPDEARIEAAVREIAV